jgi:hypothetical protein
MVPRTLIGLDARAGEFVPDLTRFVAGLVEPVVAEA